MSVLIIALLAFIMQDKHVLFQFSQQRDLSAWTIVDDNVMGGKSNGTMELNDAGYGIFKGDISLENNGGFSSVRLPVDDVEASAYSTVVIHLKGDGKPYQFRIKSTDEEYYSYVHSFNTTGDWQEIRIAFSDLKPAFRGRNLNLPPYKGSTITEIGLLFGNKKKESFKLLLKSIHLE